MPSRQWKGLRRGGRSKLRAGRPSDGPGPAEAATDHPQVVLRRYGQPIEVDEGLAALIGALWHAGIDTKYSCQGGPWPDGEDRLAYVAFSPADLARFDRLVCDQPSSWQRDTSPSPVVEFTAVRFPPADIPGIVAVLSQHLLAPEPT